MDKKQILEQQEFDRQHPIEKEDGHLYMVTFERIGLGLDSTHVEYYVIAKDQIKAHGKASRLLTRDGYTYETYNNVNIQFISYEVIK